MGERLRGTRGEDVLDRENVCRVRIWVFSPDAHVDKRPRVPAQRRCPPGEQRYPSNIEYTIRTRTKTPAKRTGPFFAFPAELLGVKTLLFAVLFAGKSPRVQRDSGYTGIMRTLGPF